MQKGNKTKEETNKQTKYPDTIKFYKTQGKKPQHSSLEKKKFYK